MKKYFLLSIMLLIAGCFVSCSDSPETLSASTAKKLFKKEIKRLNQLDTYTDVQIGYFECNDNDIRYKYRQLAANEIITYQVKKVMKQERVKKTRIRQGYWGNYKENYWTNEDVPVYFITTALTDKGKKLVYEEKEAEPSADEKELRLDFEPDKSKFPEASVKEQEFPDANAPQTENAEEEAADEPEEYDGPEEDDICVVDASDYDQEKSNETYEDVKLLAYTWSIEKARNILKTGDFTATAEIIAEVDKATPVGRIMNSRYEGQRMLVEDVKFIFYQDKGWTLTKRD